MPNPNCIALANIDEALSCFEQDNMGGIVPMVIYGYWDDVDVFPAWPSGTDALDLEEGAQLVGDLTMKAGKCAYQFSLTPDTGSFSIAPQGEQGSISFLYNLTLVSKRIRAKILGFLNAAKNRRMFFIVQDSNGEKYLMGDKHRAALLQPGDGAVTGTAPTDSNQTSIVFSYVSPRALVYTGDMEDLLTATT